MAGVLFVVVVPSARHEAELDKSTSKPLNDSTGLRKSDFHKSESFLCKGSVSNQHNSSQQNNVASLLNPTGTKLLRAVTTGALDSAGVVPDDKLLLAPPGGSPLLSAPGHNVSPLQNFLQPPLTPKVANLHGSVTSLNVPKLTVPSGNQETELDESAEEGFVHYDKMPMEKCLTTLLKKKKIENAVWTQGKNNNFYQVIFPTSSGEMCEECLECLQTCGIGTRLNSVLSVIPCSLYYEAHTGDMTGSKLGLEGSSDEEMGSDEKLRDGPSKMSAWSKFVSSVRARLTVAQVVEQVRGNAELTFDFFMLLLVAGLVAALGLVENSSVILVASMLISPLMGPILAGTFGAVIQDRQLQRVGVLHELFGLLMCLVIGFFFGLVIASAVDHWGTGDWPTAEMCARGTVRSLWVGCLIALPSGAGVALSVLGGNAGSLVGVAISASLLPPAVNAGLLWALAVIELLRTTNDPYHALSHMLEDAQNATAAAIDAAAAADAPKPFYSDYKPAELAALGAVSLCLTLLNILCIFIAGIIVLKIKEVAPRSASDDMDLFWKHDIKIARDYNRTMNAEEGKILGKELLEELGMSSEKLNVMDEKTRETIIGKFRRYSFANNGPHYNDLTISQPRSNQSTWSPGAGQQTQHRPTVQELEELYNTITGIRPRNLRRASVAAAVPGRRVSVGRAQPLVTSPPAHLATILEGNSPASTPSQSRGGLRRPSSSHQAVSQQASTGSMRFVVTPAAEPIVDNRSSSRSPGVTVELRKPTSPHKKFSF